MSYDKRSTHHKTLVITLAGSHAHRTAGPHSDIDLRGVTVASIAERVSLSGKFEQYEGPMDGELWDLVLLPALKQHETARHSVDGKVEAVIYDIAKFVELLAAPIQVRSKFFLRMSVISSTGLLIGCASTKSVIAFSPRKPKRPIWTMVSRSSRRSVYIAAGF